MVNAGGVTRTGSLVKQLEQLQRLDGVEVTVGIQGTPGTTAEGDASPEDLVMIARANEYGTDTIPPRPFLRMALVQNQDRWLQGFNKPVRLTAAGDFNGAVGALSLLGVVMVGDVQASLRDGPWTPNAESTALAKGSASSKEAQPLVHTAQMVNSVRAQVEMDGTAPVVVG